MSLGPLVGGAHHKICKISISQIFLDDSTRLERRNKNYFEVTLCNSKKSFQKIPKKEHYRKEYIEYLIWVHWLAQHAPKSPKYLIIKFGQLTARNLIEAAQIILKLHSLARMRVLRKNQGGLSNKEKLQECLIFDFGCTGWQSTPQNLLNIDLPSLVCWL